MKLYEYEGRELFKKYGIMIPKGVLVGRPTDTIFLKPPMVLKAQTLSGDRKKNRGIMFPKTAAEARKDLASLFRKKIGGEKILKVLAAEKIAAVAEYYISFSYSTDARGQVLALSPKGGSNLRGVKVFPVDILRGVPKSFIHICLQESGFLKSDMGEVAGIVERLWKLFMKEYALLAEINPLMKTPKQKFFAADAKVILDDEKQNSGERRFISMGGDIAILASGGGASLLNIDTLLMHGGRPANYTEYSGNPKAEIVRNLTKRVLSQKGLKGLWVVGGTANFTDIFETMRGFLEGLEEVKPRPKYPIVIRRDGPRQKEAIELLRSAAVEHGYDFHLFGSQTAMAESAKIIVRLAYGKQKK